MAEDTEIDKFKGLIDVKKMESDVEFNPLELDNALMQQSSLALFYGIKMAKAQYLMDRAKNQLEIAEAVADKNLRDEYATSKEKFTEPKLKAEVACDPEVIKAYKGYNKAKLVHSLTKAAVTAMEQRYQMLIQACKRADSELHTGTSYSGSSTDRAKQMLMEKTRQN